MIRSFCLNMQKTILIALAGLVGTLLRYWLAGLVSRQYGETFSWGTVGVVLIGLLGGFTTFSSYSLQTFALLRDGKFGLAMLNVVTSNILGLFMVWIGYGLSRVI